MKQTSDIYVISYYYYYYGKGDIRLDIKNQNFFMAMIDKPDITNQRKKTSHSSIKLNTVQ